MEKNSNNKMRKNIIEKSGFKKMNVGEKIIYKYMSIRHFLSSYYKREIYLANPNRWPDPFEQNYQSYIKSRSGSGPERQEDLEKLKLYYPFATCFASGLVSEQASWDAYVKGKDPVIRVAIDFQKFLEKLCRCNVENEQGLYISEMEYKSREEMLTPTPVPVMEGNEDVRDLYVKNFSLKQDAYKFEGEIRLTLLTDIENREKSSRILTGINWKNFIHHITLPPVFGGSEEETYTLKRVLKMTLDPSIELYRSTLYEVKESTEERI